MSETYHKLVDRGFITEDQLDKSLNTIRRSRPTLGELAKQRGWLNSKGILKILAKQAISTRQFGEIAMELNLLNKEQLLELIDEQERKEMNIIQALKMNGVHDSKVEEIEHFLKKEVHR